MKNRDKHNEWKRKGKTNHHHLTPRSRGGKNVCSNLLQMDYNRHSAWHLLFQNLTLEEIIALLKRLKTIKGKQQCKDYLSKNQIKKGG